jgi:hypothetical protein
MIKILIPGFRTAFIRILLVMWKNAIKMFMEITSIVKTRGLRVALLLLVLTETSAYSQIDRLFTANTPDQDTIVRNQYGQIDFALGVNIGLGIRMNSGSIRNTIDEGFIVELGSEICYNKWNYYLYFLAGPVQLQKDLPIKNVVWTKGTDANYLHYELSAGRNIIHSERHKLAPSLGVGLTRFTPYKETINKNPSFENVDVHLGNLVAGLNYQYRYPVKSLTFYYPPNYFWCINFRYALSLQITNKAIYQGFTHYFTFTWQFLIHS